MVCFKVNAISFHPVHGTLATVGSDGRFSFWDKDARTKLKTSEQLDQPITACCFNHNGNIFAYASSYDWSKVCYIKKPQQRSFSSRVYVSVWFVLSFRATSTTTPRRRTTSSWGTLQRSWSLATRNGEVWVFICNLFDIYCKKKHIFILRLAFINYAFRNLKLFGISLVGPAFKT